MAIRGRSGSGKSTLLNLIAGIDLPTAGEVWVAGTCLSRLSPAERTLFRRDHLGFVFQFFNLIPTLTVLENVQLPAELGGRAPADAAARARALLAEVGLEGRERTFPDRLSGGEQQRVAVARALVQDPRLLLADEPTGNLDDATGQSVMALLDRVTRRAGPHPRPGHPQPAGRGDGRPRLHDRGRPRRAARALPPPEAARDPHPAAHRPARPRAPPAPHRPHGPRRGARGGGGDRHRPREHQRAAGLRALDRGRRPAAPPTRCSAGRRACPRTSSAGSASRRACARARRSSRATRRPSTSTASRSTSSASTRSPTRPSATTSAAARSPSPASRASSSTRRPSSSAPPSPRATASASAARSACRCRTGSRRSRWRGSRTPRPPTRRRPSRRSSCSTWARRSGSSAWATGCPASTSSRPRPTSPASPPLLPAGARVAPASEQASTVGQLTDAFQLNLTALSLLALVVGMFLIYNTVMFSVVQRRAVIGTLRLLGATGRQVFALVLLETAAASAVGTLLGLGLGWLLGQGAVRLVTQTINDLYYVLSVTGAPLTPFTVAKAVALGLGAGVALRRGPGPRGRARRAGRGAPPQHVREPRPPARPARGRRGRRRRGARRPAARRLGPLARRELRRPLRDRPRPRPPRPAGDRRRDGPRHARSPAASPARSGGWRRARSPAR